MNTTMMKCGRWVILVSCLVLLVGTGALAQEVKKGEIPSEHLARTCKQLPWGVPVWDNEEAIAALQDETKVLWVDTRPASFFQKGTVRGAVLMAYDITDSQDNQLSADGLEAAIAKAGLTKEDTKIVFFCQGPECHRSYNAAFRAVKEWGYAPTSVVWFRDGYPNLIQDVTDNAALKRKAKLYLSDEALSQL
ncbi:MAG: rhodanese-like domain-containing protein [Syntrophobacteraceae bacterium]